MIRRGTSRLPFDLPVEHHWQMRQNSIVVVNTLFVDSIWHQDIDD